MATKCKNCQNDIRVLTYIEKDQRLVSWCSNCGTLAVECPDGKIFWTIPPLSQKNHCPKKTTGKDSP